MSDEADRLATQPLLGRLETNRRQLLAIRQTAALRLQQPATGSQIAGGIALGFEELLKTLLNEACGTFAADEQRKIIQSGAVLAVGGFGRGEMAPYSDVDLLFLYRPQIEPLFASFVAQVVRDSWDTGVKISQSVRTVRDALSTARTDIQFATSLTSGRRLWGSEELAQELLRRFQRQILRRQRTTFLAECIAAREEERQEAGGAVLQLEPDIKRSYGGLRDIHLLRWIGYAKSGTSDPASLRLHGEITSDESLRLTAAQDFLLTLRTNLHLHDRKAHDVLTRDHQLRIASEQAISGSSGQRPVEKFMQTYFRHSLAVAEIADRLVARHRRASWLGRLGRFLLTVRIDDIYLVGAGRLDVRRRDRVQVCQSLEGVLRVYLTAARYRVIPTDRLQAQIEQHSREFSADISPEAAELFLQMLAAPGRLGPLLRSLFHLGVLEIVLPALKHVRCLLQFNQYHSYTVDEHTLRTIEIAEQFEVDTGPIGETYRELRHKEILHLALLLHDAGKGFPEDHSEIGQRLAVDAAKRLQLSEASRELLEFLVHRHLLMADLAFRRDSSDPSVLLQFSHAVGSPETLKHLYVMTVADISAVGPGVWTEWKADLLATLFQRTMQWLSGQSHRWEATSRRTAVLRDVIRLLPAMRDRVELRRLWDQFPDHYLFSTTSEQIAGDLQIVAARATGDLHVEGRYEPETGTVLFRVITHEQVVQGCFHKLTGVLTALRMGILTASICTSQTGVIIDGYQVFDGDFDGEVPQFRIDEVCQTIRRILSGNNVVESLLNNRRRIDRRRFEGPVSNLPLRVVIDQDSSERFTILEVFAHDQPGLLYLVARTIFELELSVIRARISTHFDQVVDGFYVTDRDGRKIEDEQRLKGVQDRLVEEIRRLEPNSLTNVRTES